MLKADVDVAIIGGGPAGSSTASYLAKAGLKCAVFERELFPRPHVGESLVPAATRVLRDIGCVEQMDQVGFVRKFGAVWTAASNPRLYQVSFEGVDPDCTAEIRFEERQQTGVDRNYTWHVDRGKFDLLLLQHANRLGAAVYEGCKVNGVDFSAPSLPRVKFSICRKELSVSSHLVVDASGRQTLLGNQLKLKKNDPVFDQYALHAWFEGYDRLVMSKKRELENYIFVHFLPITDSWMWQIPITDTVTSIGVVTQKKRFEKSRESREKFFWNCIRTRPELFDALQGATQLRPLKEEGDYSYGMSQLCGDGFLLVGDAARFVDPIFSSGISIALNSARLASQDILKAAQNGSFEREQFGTFQTLVRRGTNNWYEFISAYYRLNVLFTYFINDRRYRLDVLKLLQGDLYDEDRPHVLDEMIKTVKNVEQNENHPWHRLLGELTGDTFRPAF
jgi:flavin-dependent dehydrogenase